MSPELLPVAIIGAGPVGLTLANLLGGFGIRCALFEREPTLCDHPRAVGVDADCLRVWQAAGLVDTLLPDTNGMGREGLGMVYLDPRGRPFLEVRPQRREQGFPFGCGIVQPLVDRVLLRGLERYPQVAVHFGVEITSASQSAHAVSLLGRTLAGERVEVEAGFAIACDGGASAVRRALGVAMPGSAERGRWLVLDALVPDPPADRRDAEIRCDSGRAMVRVPRPGGHVRFEFGLRDHENAAALLAPERIRALLAEHGEAESAHVLRAVVHRFQTRLAARYRVGRVLLAGDAAHVTPPYAAQGLSLGVRDAANLAWKLALVLRGHASEELLDSYESERRPDARACLRLATGLGWLMQPRSRLRARLLPGALRALGRWPRVQRYLREAGPRPAQRLRAGWWLRADAVSLAGRKLPQPDVRCADGSARRLDDWLGEGFALLGFATAPDAALRPDLLAAWRALGTRFLTLLPAGVRARSEREAEDADAAFAARFGARTGNVLLVRPDRFVAADVGRAALDAALARLLEQLGAPPAPYASEPRSPSRYPTPFTV